MSLEAQAASNLIIFSLGAVGGRFENAAQTYEQATPIQRIVATELADCIGKLVPPPNGKVAEFGCGVGYLAEATLPILKPQLWLATDIAFSMMAMTRRRLSMSQIVACVMDARGPALSGGFDLVCSSMILHWLQKPKDVVEIWRNLARPAGWLAIATPIEGTFSEWRNALSRSEVCEPQPIFPTLKELTSWFKPESLIYTIDLREQHSSGLDFLRMCRSAGVDAGGERPASAGAMRRALSIFDDCGASVSYRVAFALERV